MGYRWGLAPPQEIKTNFIGKPAAITATHYWQICKGRAKLDQPPHLSPFFCCLYVLTLSLQLACTARVCRILIYYDGVEMSFDMPGSMPHFKGNKKGRVYLTTHRVSVSG